MPVEKHFFANHVDEIFKEHQALLIKKEEYKLAITAAARKIASEIVAKALNKREDESKESNESEEKLIPYGF